MSIGNFTTSKYIAKSFVKRKKCITLKQLKMKKLVFGLIATISLVFNVNAQDSNFNNFFESAELGQLLKTFSINVSDINRCNYDFVDHESKEYKIYRVQLKDNNSITFFTNDNGKTYGLAYEKDNLEKGIAEHYDEYGNLYAKFTISKNDKGLYSYKINEVYNPEETGNPTNKQRCSVWQVYKKLKSACESDAFCDMMCDLPVSFCHGMLLNWAVAFCATRN